MSWIYIPTKYSKTGKTKYINPRLQCSNCGAVYSEHWLRFIGSEQSGDGEPPRYCPDCGFLHSNKSYCKTTQSELIAKSQDIMREGQMNAEYPTFPDELAAIREYHNKRNRDWWHRMTKEERREKRNQYALNAIRRKQKENNEAGETNGQR